MGHNKKNKVVLSTIFFSPKFCEKNRPHYSLNIEKTKQVNDWILKFNSMATGLTLDLSKFGIRKVSNFNDGIQFVYSAWKENEIHKKLHLS